MAEFSPALEYTLRNEDKDLSGVISAEPGGYQARYGINSHAHPEAVEAGLYDMSRDAALEWASATYRKLYFEPIGGFQIKYQIIANKFFDLAVNTGLTQATKIIQRAANSVSSGPLNLGLQVDGKIGQRTIDAINQADPNELMVAIRDYGRQFYTDLARRTPADKQYLEGWLTRLNS